MTSQAPLLTTASTTSSKAPAGTTPSAQTSCTGKPDHTAPLPSTKPTRAWTPYPTLAPGLSPKMTKATCVRVSGSVAHIRAWRAVRPGTSPWSYVVRPITPTYPVGARPRIICLMSAGGGLSPTTLPGHGKTQTACGTSFSPWMDATPPRASSRVRRVGSW